MFNNYKDLDSEGEMVILVSESANQITKRHFGSMRTLAVLAKRANPALDEEAFFEKLVKSWVRGMRSELRSVFGIEKAAELLDPFKRHG